jgi:sarcosine oxidase subunit gamma
MPSFVALAAGARRGPLEGRSLPDGARFSLRAAPDAARFVLRGEREVAALAGAAFGAPIPLKPCRAESLGTRASIWLGPDEWLLLAEGEEPAPLVETLETALAGRPHSLVDVSQRQIGVEAAGPLAARALSAGCPLDLSEAAFPAGMATRTMLAKSEIVLWRREPTRFHVEVWRSFADYAASFLIEAARRAPSP